MLEYTNEFEQRFWMSWSMFDDLVEELHIPLTVSFTQSLRSTSGNEPIYPEMIVAIGDFRTIKYYGIPCQQLWPVGCFS
jgi:hypothetical protein